MSPSTSSAPHFDSLTSRLSLSAGWLSRPRLAGLHRLHHHVRRRGALPGTAAQAVVPAHICVHLAGQDSRFCQFYLLKQTGHFLKCFEKSLSISQCLFSLLCTFVSRFSSGTTEMNYQIKCCFRAAHCSILKTTYTYS